MKLRFLLLTTLLIGAWSVSAQEGATLHSAIKSEQPKSETEVSYKPEVFGAVKAKFEMGLYDGEYRFNVRNSRLGVRGSVSPNMKYSMQIDLNNEGKISILDSYATIHHKNFEFTLGQQQYCFNAELDRGPTTSYFANRSFLAKFLTTYYGSENDKPYVKSIGSRDIGALARYKVNNSPFRLSLGAFNGAGSNNPEWSNNINIISRIDIGNTKKGLSGAISNYTGNTPAKYIVNADCASNSETCAPIMLKQKLVMWGGEVAFATPSYRVEMQYAQRRLNDLHVDVLHAAVVQGFYIFQLPKNSFAEYLSPLLRWDLGKDIEYYNNIAKNVANFSAQRITFGVNLGFMAKVITSEVRLNYEKYLYNTRPADYSSNKLFHDKFTLEIIAAF